MRKLKASATVEMAYIMPVIFFTFIAVIYILFYFHDKNIVIGAGYETVTTGSRKLRMQEEDTQEELERLFQERVKGKLIFFSNADAKVICEKDQITVKAELRKKRMKIQTEQKMKVTRPEKTIRNLRRINGNKV